MAGKTSRVVCVAGTPGDGWLSEPSDEQAPETVCITTDPDLVARYTNEKSAQRRLEFLVNAHPLRSFRIAHIPALPANKRRTTAELVADADARGSALLADANQARDAGDNDKAERLYARSQKWLDKSNRLRGCH